MVENVPSSSWDCFCLLLLTEPFVPYQHQWHLCYYLEPVCSWQRTNGEKTFFRKSNVNTRGMDRSRRNGEACKDGVWGFGGLLGCRQVFCSHLRLWLYGLDCLCSLVTGAYTAGQLNADRRSGWRWEGGASSLWDLPLVDTENRAGGDFSPTRMESSKEDFVVFHLLFIWMLSLLLVCLLLWNSVISLIMKFKYINFYLVYRYLFSFSVGELVCECVWGYVMHVAYCVRTNEGMWS